MIPTKFLFIGPSGFKGEDFWLISKKSSPLKPLGQMNGSLVGKTSLEGPL
jgi:hypothetical protein